MIKITLHKYSAHYYFKILETDSKTPFSPKKQ